MSTKRSDSGKVYSLHEPDVKCYTKGKGHKKFEFGSKASFLVTQSTGVIVGALNFTESLHDSKTLPSVLEQYERLMDKEAKNVFLDRGYQGPKMINNTALQTPKPDKDITQTKRKRHKRRAAIEPIIGHLKHDYRMSRNYLKGTVGDAINVILAAAAMNFKRMMNKWKVEFIFGP
ncbi:MAG: transposase [Chitinophagaceae bacterium]|nr:transposase [Chitinophagaceae bacterium]